MQIHFLDYRRRSHRVAVNLVQKARIDQAPFPPAHGVNNAAQEHAMTHTAVFADVGQELPSKLLAGLIRTGRFDGPVVGAATRASLHERQIIDRV